MVHSVSIIGTGQVGTSIALALTANAPHIRITMSDPDKAAAHLVKQKFHDTGLSSDHITFSSSARKAVAGSELVILATPVSAFSSVIRNIKNHIPPGAIVTDTGSAKIEAIGTITEALTDTGIPYVPAHPGNGSQGSGPLSAKADNILGATSWMFLVHDQESGADPAVSAVRDFWKSAGVQVAETDAFTHDRFFGTCSHLQHAIAFSVMNMARDDNALLERFKSGGTIFRNMTRLAISRQEEGQPSTLVRMWQPIFQQNRKMILAAAEQFTMHFDAMTGLAARNERSALKDFLQPAHDFRKSLYDPEPRETIKGEFADARNPGGPLHKKFNHEALARLYSNLLLPIVIANSQTLNARDVSVDLVQGKANPSFRDGTAASLFDPGYVADLLTGHAAELSREASAFRISLEDFTHRLRLNDADGIAEFIQSAQTLRTPLPGPRKGALTRQEYLLRKDAV